MAERRLELVSLDELQRAPRNVKQHAVDGIGSSIARWGVIDLPTVDERTGHLIAGHGRLKALEAAKARGDVPPEGVVAQNGSWLVPTVRGWSSADDNEADAARVALNQWTIEGGWDDRLLADQLSSLADVDAELLAVTGFDQAALDAMLAALSLEDDRAALQGKDLDEVPESPAEPISQRGDLWLLGPHRLLCGDSTVPAVHQRLLEGRKASCVWTDPPYGVDYVGKTDDHLTIQNDGAVSSLATIKGVLQAVSPFVEPGSPFYLAAPAGPQGTAIRLVVAEAGWLLHEELVWVKDQFVLGHSDYHYRHEPILYGWLPGPGRSGRGNHDGTRWQGDHAQDSVFEVPRPRRSESHPNMKPVDLIMPHLSNSSAGGGIVLDPFGGSGSTLIAAHQLGRVATLVEIDPRYADVICRRYQTLTGSVPRREDGTEVGFLTE